MAVVVERHISERPGLDDYHTLAALGDQAALRLWGAKN